MDDETELSQRELAARIGRVLQSHGMHFDTDGETARFEVDGHSLEREAHWLPTMVHVGSMRRWRENPRPGVYLTDRITPTVARKIRDGGGWYADAAGNMFLRAPGVFVDVSGRAPVPERKTAARGATPHNLMSAGRAQVVLAVLTWPQLLTQSLREIGQAAGVSTAAAHKALKLLEEERYLTHSRQLMRRDELIDLWASSYPLGLARSTEVGRYRGEPNPTPWAALGHRVYVSGEYAATELAGPDLVLYVSQLDTKALIQSRWQRPETNDDGNIIVRRAFWTAPDRWDESPGVDLAPPLLVYGDLLASNDPRQREVASAMRGDL